MFFKQFFFFIDSYIYIRSDVVYSIGTMQYIELIFYDKIACFGLLKIIIVVLYTKVFNLIYNIFELFIQYQFNAELFSICGIKK